MATVEQLAHKHTISASRTLTKAESSDELVAGTKLYLSEVLATHLAKKQVRVSLDGETVDYSLNLVVLTMDELKALVKGVTESNPNQGELYAGDDAQAG